MLLSGNGRHRRPRQAPKFVVTAGATGAGVALPLLGAGAANAAPTEVWDQVAQCETGGDWGTNTGNGFYGGLQFSQDTWEAYGGTDFAERADLADRAQQIAVAEKVLKDQGPSAWENCSVMAGLESGGAPADVQKKAYEGHIVLTPRDDAGAAEDSGKDTDERSGKSGDGGTASGSGPAAEEGRGAAGAGGAAGAERFAGEREQDREPRADRGAGTGRQSAEGYWNGTGTGSAGGGPEQDSTRSANGSSGGGRSQDSEAGTGAAGAGSRAAGDAVDASPSGASGGDYVVRPGDTLTRIADAQELDGGWHGLYEANRDTLGEDPDLILPGQELYFRN